MPLPAAHHFPAVLFDLDGTLINTIPDLADAGNAMRVDLGRAPVAEADIARYVGKGVEHMIACTLEHGGAPADPALMARAVTRFRDHYRRLNGRRSRLYPGVAEGLQLFRQTGARLAVVTNKTAEFTPPLLHQMGLDSYFDIIVCGDTCARKKPDPLPLFYACRLLNVDPRTALFIGDSINDAQAARAAGMPMLAVPYGYNEGRPVQQLPANAIVDSLVEGARWAAAASKSPTE